MQPLNYFFASVISFLGLLAGFMLIKTAPEEQKPLQKYFVFFRKLLLLPVSVFLIFYYFNDLIYFIVLILPIFFLLLTEYKTKDLGKKLAISYSIFGILFYMSSKNMNLFAIESSLIFLYGLPAASLIYRKGKNQKMIFYGIGFIAVSNILFLTI